MGKKTSDNEQRRLRNSSVLVAVCILGMLALASAFAVKPAVADDSLDMVYPVYNPKPKGLPPVPIPEDNPQTPIKVKLGEKLYFDPMLSSDGTISCASCHSPALGFADGEQVSDGVGGQTGGRNSPSVYNAAYYTTQFWDGRAMDLEHQAMGPVENPIEMANTWANVVSYLESDKTYQRLFKQAFGGDISMDTAVKAIASYERTVITWDSPYDRYVAGDMTAMSVEQVAGMDLFFGKAQCSGCHAPPLFLEDAFGNIGIPDAGFESVHFPNSDEGDPTLWNHDLGRYYVTHLEEDLGRFKTPGLRNIELTAPYMHNGVLATLEAVIAHYNSVPDPVVGVLEEDLVTELGLSDIEQAQLVAFLKALTGKVYTYEPEMNMDDMVVSMLSQILIRTWD